MQSQRFKNPVIRECFQACQDSFSTHPSLVKKLRKYYDSNDADRFFESFIYYIKLPLSGLQERSPYIEKILEFVAKFACSFLKKDEEKETEKEEDENKEDEEEEEELPLFLYRLYMWLLDHHSAESVDARLRVCQLLNKLLKYMGEEACIDDELYNKIYYGMLERLKDKVADIRSQAVTALQRLQDPKDDDCPIIKAYLFHLAHDPNSIVRRTIVRCIGATRLTLPHILERTRDADEGVRRAAYFFLSEKVHIKSLTIGQREGVLQRGLNERSDNARKVVEKDLMAAWLRLSNNNIIQLLHHLDVGNSEQKFKAGQQTSAPAEALEVLFKDLSYQELIANFQYVDVNKLIPKEKLTPETALYWRVLIQYLAKQEDDSADEQLDRLRPELTPFCNYVRSYILSLTSEDDELNWEFIAKELIVLCSFYDLGDEVGRKNLAKLIKDLLISDKIPATLIPQLVYIFTRVEKSPQARIDQIAEVIAELKDPISNDRERGLASPSTVTETIDNIDHKLVRTLQLEVAKLMVTLNQHRDELETAITNQDFLNAQQVKTSITEVEARRKELEAQIEEENNKVIVKETIVESSTGEESQPSREDPVITLKCLKLLVASLQDPSITQLNATLHTLLEELVVCSVQSEIASIRKEAITSLACFCLRSIEDARRHMLLLLQAAHIDVPEVRIAAITAVIDLLMRHGLTAFITSKEKDKSQDVSGTEADLSETSSSIETALESDFATKGASLTQSELDSQGGNSVVAILSKMLDEPDLELRTEVAEGLCKLLMIGSIASPKIISRLLLMWYNPMTESDSKLRHILGTFFPLYASMTKGHQSAFQQAFVPTMKVLFDAPVTSPLAEIDTEDVGMFFVHLTREDLLQSYQGRSSANLEGESTVSGVHDELAFAVCNEILSSPDSMQTKILVKILSSLQVTTNNFVVLRELKVLSEQLLQHVRDKLIRKSLDKFDRAIQDWLARDPTRTDTATADKRPASETTTIEDANDITATPGKKKRILFSQSVLGNPLLQVEEEIGDSDVLADSTGVLGSPAARREIPSPVVQRPLNPTFEKALDSTIDQTKEMTISPPRATSGDLANGMGDLSITPPPTGTRRGRKGRKAVVTSESDVNSSLHKESAEAEPITVIPGTPETEPTDSDAPSANEDSELSEPTNGESSQESTEDESEIFLTPPEEEESDKPAKKSGKKAEKRQSRSRVAPATPEKRVQPAIPGSPGLSRSGRKNSPRIDYRTGKAVRVNIEKITVEKTRTGSRNRLVNGASDTESPARRSKNTPTQTKEAATKTAPTKPTPKSKEAVAKKIDEKKDKENRSKSKETVTTAKKDDKTTSSRAQRLSNGVDAAVLTPKSSTRVSARNTPKETVTNNKAKNTPTRSGSQSTPKAAAAAKTAAKETSAVAKSTTKESTAAKSAATAKATLTAAKSANKTTPRGSARKREAPTTSSDNSSRTSSPALRTRKAGRFVDTSDSSPDTRKTKRTGTAK